MADQQIRQIAHKVWISDIVDNEFVHQEGEWDPNYTLAHGKKISRVNIIANTISKYKSENGDYIALTVDDNSGNIQIKSWKDDVTILDKIEVGDTLLIIGRIREYSGQVYLTPEIVKKLQEPEWLGVRKKELINEYEELPNKKEHENKERKNTDSEKLEVVEEEVVEIQKPIEGNRQKILNIIENLSSEEGADKIEIMKESKLDEQESNKLLQELLKEGEIFEIKPGKIKSLG